MTPSARPPSGSLAPAAWAGPGGSVPGSLRTPRTLPQRPEGLSTRRELRPSGAAPRRPLPAGPLLSLRRSHGVRCRDPQSRPAGLAPYLWVGPSLGRSWKKPLKKPSTRSSFAPPAVAFFSLRNGDPHNRLVPIPLWLFQSFDQVHVPLVTGRLCTSVLLTCSRPQLAPRTLSSSPPAFSLYLIFS